jgi:hypothetical protein
MFTPATRDRGSSAPRNLANIMAVAVTGDFEGSVTLGVGMRRQSWVRVSLLTCPDRVVIDVGREDRPASDGGCARTRMGDHVG